MSKRGVSVRGARAAALGEKAVWSLLLSYYLLILIIISRTNINSIHHAKSKLHPPFI
jgi:hypothetical protein